MQHVRPNPPYARPHFRGSAAGPRPPPEKATTSNPSARIRSANAPPRRAGATHRPPRCRNPTAGQPCLLLAAVPEKLGGGEDEGWGK